MSNDPVEVEVWAQDLLSMPKHRPSVCGSDPVR